MMRKTGKRGLSMLLCLILLVSVLPKLRLPTLAAVYNGSCGKSVQWNLDTATGTLTISGNGAMDNYYPEDDLLDMWDAYLPPWEAYWKEIKTVQVQNGITNIGDHAFSGYQNLTSVSISNSVSEIGDYAFAGCTGLTSVVLPKSVTAIGSSAFQNCSSLMDLAIPDGVTRIGDHAFYGCTVLKSVSLPKGVTRMSSYMFGYNLALTSVTIPEWITSIGSHVFEGCSNITSAYIPDTVTYMDYHIFENCSNLTSVRLPENMKRIGAGMFSGCRSLTTITIPQSVTEIMSSAFENCHSLSSITIPQSVTEIGLHAFYCCKSLTTVTIPDGVEIIDMGTFYSCEKLTTVNIPEGVKEIDVIAFSDCYSLTEITIPKSVTTIGYDAFADCSSLTSVTFLGDPPAITTYYTSVYVFNRVTATAFYPCSNQKWSISRQSSYGGTMTWQEGHAYGNIIAKDATCGLDATWVGTCLDCGITKTFTSPDTAIGHKYDTNRMCCNCGKQFRLVVYMTDTYGDSWNGSAIEVYAGDTLLTEVSLSGGLLSGESEVPFVLGQTYTLKWKSGTDDDECGFKVVLNDENLVSGQGSHYKDGQILCTFTNGCDHVLTEVTVTDPTCTEDGYTMGQCTVCGFDGVVETAPALGHDYVDGICTTCGDEDLIASGTCGENLQWRLNIVGTLTISGIGDMNDYTAQENGVPDTPWYFHRQHITKVVIEDGVTAIGEYAFHGCTALTDVTLPGTVTTIGKLAFYNCEGLSDVTLPQGITTIGSAAFRRCGNLTDLTLPEGLTTIGKIAFFDCTGLREMTIPKSVTTMGEYAFGNCTGLTTVTFNGAAPAMDSTCLKNVTATAVYPCTDATWTDAAKQSYGGAVTWKADHTEKNIPGKAPTCTETGLTDGVQCSVCNEVLTPQQTVPVIDHEYLVTQVPVTCTGYGYELHQCQNCGNSVYYNVTAPTGHRYENGVCTACGDGSIAILPGDVNGDGERNIIDVSVLYAHVKETQSLDSDFLPYADVNGDGNVDIADTARLYAHVKGTKPLN